LNNTFHQEDVFEDKAYDGRMTYRRVPKWMTNPNPNRRGGFLFLILVGEEEMQVLKNIG